MNNDALQSGCLRQPVGLDVSLCATIGGKARYYISDGNMLTNGNWTYTWNGENRLTAATDGTKTLTFAYDYAGRRISKQVSEGSTPTAHTRFVYDKYKLIEELDALNSNALLRQYTWQPESVGLDVPLTLKIGSDIYYYHTDVNKNIIALTDSAGVVGNVYRYSPFGQIVTVSEIVENPFRFSGEYFDEETGLIYYNYRYYSPTLGRWLSMDPIGEKGGWNLYGMLGNNAILRVDGLGLASLDNSCGVDVTDELNSLLKRMEQEFLNENNKKYRKLLDVRLSPEYINAGWDIPAFSKQNAYPDSFAPADPQKERRDEKSRCNGTVTYNGKCYKTEHLNYAMFGRMSAIRTKLYNIVAYELINEGFFQYRLVERYPDWEVALNLVLMYSPAQGDFAGNRYMFTLAGFKSFGKDMLPAVPSADLSSCCKTSSIPLSESPNIYNKSVYPLKMQWKYGDETFEMNKDGFTMTGSSVR